MKNGEHITVGIDPGASAVKVAVLPAKPATADACWAAQSNASAGARWWT